MPITSEKKVELIEKFGQNEKDTGSSEAQVAIMSQRISDLTKHLKTHKKDYSTRRGLMLLVGKRRRLLNYLKDNRDPETYKTLLKDLKLRK